MEVMKTASRKRAMEIMGANINILVSSEETNGQHAIIEFDVPPGFPGAPPQKRSTGGPAFRKKRGRMGHPVLLLFRL